MSDDLNTEIKIGADASGVEAGVGRAKRSLKDLGDSARSAGQTVAAAGKQAGESLATVGDGGEAAAKKIQRDTRSMQSSLQRYLATLEAGSKDSRKYWESMADFKGVDKAALRPLLDQLDAYKAKANAAADASSAFKLSFGGFGVAATALTAVSATAGVAAKAMFDASVSAERLRTMLDFSTGGNSAREIEYLRGVTARLGLEFTSTAKAYGQFQAAAKGTALEGDKARAVFESVAKASAVMGLSADDTSGVLLALQQMLSKGTVSAEELRGQLGERLPGSFQVAARAMGVTTAELGKMLEQGQVVADDFLPKFGRALEENLGGAAEKAANRLDASVNRLNTAWDRLKQNGGDAGTSSFMAGQYEILADGFNGVSEAMERARSSGSGFIGQMSAGAVAVAKFANPLQAFSYTAIESGNALKQAEEEFAALQARGDQMGGNIYYKAEMARLAALIKELKTAQDEKDKLTKGDDSKINPGIVASGQGRERYYQQREKDEEAANAFRLKQAGVPASYLKDMAELIRLNQAGVIVGKEYTDALKAQQDLLLKKTTTVRGSAAAANAEQNAYESLIASIRAKIEADNLEIAGGAALTESQRIRIKLDQDLAAGRVKLSAQNERAVRLALEELAASEASALAAKTLAKANLDAAASREKYLTSLSTGLDKIQADIAAQIEATERMGLSKEAIAELDAAKLEMLATDLELQAIKAMDRNLDQQTYDALKKQAAAYRELGIAKKGGAAKEAALEMEKANAEAAKKAQEDWERASEQINSSLTDALMRGFESGKDFAKNLRDTVVNMFKTMVLRPVISAVVNPVAGALTGALGFAGTASAATGAASGGSGIGSIVSAGSSIYSALTTGVSNSITSAFSKFATSSVGTSLGLSTPAVVGNNPSAYVAPQLSSAGSAIGTGLGMLGSGLAGYGISSAISNGYTTGGNTVNVLSGIASAIPGIGPIAGVVGGLINRAFGRKLKDTGIEGTLGGAEGFEGQQYKFYKGGWFRSDETKYSELDDDVQKMLSTSFRAIQAQVGTFATVLGLETDRIASFTTDIKVSFKGLDEAGIQEALQDALATGSNELAQQVIGTWTTTTREVTETLAGDWGDWSVGTMQTVTRTIEETTYAASEYAREGEKAIDTLTRLATSLGTVNTIWENLGFTLYDASLRGADAASKMADAFGGLENLASATSVYYENFYTDAEKTANTTRDVAEALAEVGLEMPKTREGFRALVEAQMALGESGTKAVATLLQVSGTFATITTSIDQAAEAAKAEAAKAAKADANERRAFVKARREMQEAQQKAEQKAELDAIEAAKTAAADLFKSIQDHIKGIDDWLKGTLLDTNSLLSPEGKVQEAQAQFDALYARAAGGDAQAMGMLTEAASTLRDVARDAYASSGTYGAIEMDLRARLAALDAGAFDPNRPAVQATEWYGGGGVQTGVSFDLADAMAVTGLGFESASLLTSNKRYEQAFIDGLKGLSQSDAVQALLRHNRATAFGDAGPQFYTERAGDAGSQEYLRIALANGSFASAGGGANAGNVYQMGLQFGLTDDEVRQGLSLMGKGAQADTEFWQSNWSEQSSAIGNWVKTSGQGQDTLVHLYELNQQMFQSYKEAVEAIRGSGEAQAQGQAQQIELLQSVDKRLADQAANARMGAIA